MIAKLAIKYLQYYAKRKYGDKLRTKTRKNWEYELQGEVIK